VATYHAIAAVGQALLGMLEDACPRDEFPAAQFALFQAADFQNPPIKEGVSLYLYRVAVNGTQRNRPARLAPGGRRFRPSLPLDLHYLMTPWAETAAKQQRLLGWSMRVLEDMAILPAGLLNHPGPEPDTFAPAETVELVCEPISLQDMANVWEAFKMNLQLSAAYVARMVLIDSALEVAEGPPAQTRALGFAKGPQG
jgi:hypothetical protein